MVAAEAGMKRSLFKSLGAQLKVSPNFACSASAHLRTGCQYGVLRHCTGLFVRGKGVMLLLIVANKCGLCADSPSKGERFSISRDAAHFGLADSTVSGARHFPQQLVDTLFTLLKHSASLRALNKHTALVSTPYHASSMHTQPKTAACLPSLPQSGVQST